MKQIITNYIQSPTFQNILGKSFNINKPFDLGLIETKETPSIKNKNGLYFMYDPNNSKVYSKPALWYLGISGNTIDETYRKRIIKHRRHALQLQSKSGTNKNWAAFNAWLQQKSHAGVSGVWDTNCRVVWFEMPDLTKQELLLLEANCIKDLNPVVNGSINTSLLQSL